MSVFCSLFLTKIDFKSVFSASHPATKILHCTNEFYKDQYSEVLFTSPWRNGVELLARLLEGWSSVTRLWVEKIWSSVTSSRYISIRQISAGRYLRILDVLVLAFGQRRKNLSRLGYCQSNCLNSWSSKIRINTVHYIWNTNNWTLKIFPVQLKFWNGPLFPTYMYLST